MLTHKRVTSAPKLLQGAQSYLLVTKKLASSGAKQILMAYLHFYFLSELQPTYVIATSTSLNIC